MLKIPCITLRNNSEWMETILDGWNILVGCNKEKIVDAIINFTCHKKQKNHFGDGQASRKICEVLDKYSNYSE
jgi:UDP-N-acetylglucosamine 2-epimerase